MKLPMMPVNAIFIIPKLICLVSFVLSFRSYYVTATNSTKTTTPDLPLAVPQPRLPSSYSVTETNSTDSYVEAPSKAKKIIDPKEETALHLINRTSHPVYESSSSTSRENYITIGDNLRFSNYSKNIVSGFQPFLPSPLFVPAPEYKPQYKEYESQEYRYNSPAKQEQFYQPYYNNYPIRGVAQTVGTDEPVYSKYYEPEKLPYITTFSPPKINPMHRPSYYKKKGPHYNPPKPFEYHIKHQTDFQLPAEYMEPPTELIDDFGHDLYHKPTHLDGKRRRNGMLHLLATLIPLGLLLTALPPRVVFINSTNPTKGPQGQKMYFRNIEKELLQIHNISDSASNILQNLGLQPSDQPNCNKLKLCEAALKEAHISNSHEDTYIWQLLSRSSDAIRESLDLQDVFEAVMRKQCFKFSCIEQLTIEKSDFQSYDNKS